MFESAVAIDKNGSLPRHAQVSRILREMITSGRLKPGDKIPAEVEIADRLGVSKMTVNKALLALTSEGLFVREIGRGTFVAGPQALKNIKNRGNGASATRRLRVTLPFVQSAASLLETDYYGSLYRAICETLTGRGIEVDLSPVRADEAAAQDGGADGGIFIAPHARSITAIEALWDAGRAVVVIGASWPGMRVPSVDSDNVGGAMAAVRHLAEQGHRRIGLLYTQAESANTQDRILGYRSALSALNLPHHAGWEVESRLAHGAGETERLRDLFCCPEPVTAVFAAGYHLALEAMNAARNAGLDVPEEFSVVGYDDPLSAQLVYPPLTTLRQPLAEMGRRAAERVLHLLSGEDPRAIVREVVPPELIVRGSTAVVAAARGT